MRACVAVLLLLALVGIGSGPLVSSGATSASPTGVDLYFAVVRVPATAKACARWRRRSDRLPTRVVSSRFDAVNLRREVARWAGADTSDIPVDVTVAMLTHAETVPTMLCEHGSLFAIAIDARDRTFSLGIGVRSEGAPLASSIVHDVDSGKLVLTAVTLDDTLRVLAIQVRRAVVDSASGELASEDRVRHKNWQNDINRVARLPGLRIQMTDPPKDMLALFQRHLFR